MMGGKYYGWLENFDSPFCMTISTCVDEGRLLGEFGGEIGDSWQSTFAAEAAGDSDVISPDTRVGVGVAGGVGIAIEPNGWHGNAPGVGRKLSKSGRCFSVYLNVEGELSILYAAAGRVVVFGEPFDDFGDVIVDPDGWRHAWQQGLFGPDATVSRSEGVLKVIERCMDVYPDPEWFRMELRFSRVPSTEELLPNAWDY
jgi:hypothetical protein